MNSPNDTVDEIANNVDDNTTTRIETTREDTKELNKEPDSLPSNDHNEHTKLNQEHASNHQNIIIIKRIKKHHNKHHGGAWKIAYADFVTAMMTFFLLLWLLSMLNKYQLEGISHYFKDPSRPMAQQIDPKLDKIQQAKSTTTDSKTLSQIDKSKLNDDQKKQLAVSEQIKNDLQNQLKSNPKISEFQNSLNFVVLSQGLKIELKDLENKPMFSTGKTDFGAFAKEIIGWLGPAMNKYPNRIMIIGHTDSKPYKGVPNYSNWELSADRANATRRELINNGMEPNKIVRVVGVADIDKLETAKDENDPSNRRIVIIILTEDAYKKMQAE